MIFINSLLQDCECVNTQVNASIEIVSRKRICHGISCHLSPKHYTNHIQIIYTAYSLFIYIIKYAAFAGRRILGQSSNQVFSSYVEVKWRPHELHRQPPSPT